MWAIISSSNIVAGDRRLFPAMYSVHRAADDRDAEVIRGPGLERVRNG